MDTLENMKKALDYLEDHLSDEIDYAKVAQIALCSPCHFQQMFSFLIEIPLSEYVRRQNVE